MLRHTLPLLVVASLGALLFAAGASSKSQATPVLTGATGPGFVITLKKANGTLVKSLHAGTYKFVVRDKSGIHNFVVEKEKGANKIERKVTTVSFVGTKTVFIKLTPGTWKYYCAPHEAGGMGHTFVVM
jgi:hypothetical protein